MHPHSDGRLEGLRMLNSLQGGRGREEERVGTAPAQRCSSNMLVRPTLTTDSQVSSSCREVGCAAVMISKRILASTLLDSRPNVI